jgi:hypothetical protein
VQSRTTPAIADEPIRSILETDRSWGAYARVDLGIETIVLNVERANQPAIDMHQNLGFMPYCGFYEGITVLI